jgi:hypothetical protein
MTPPSHLASIRELGDIRRESPRASGETEDQYYQRLALELGRRQRAQRPRTLLCGCCAANRAADHPTPHPTLMHQIGAMPAPATA